MKIGLDTNVVIRFMVNDDDKQAAIVEKELQQILKSGGKVFISNLVILETIWVLSSTYKATQENILDGLFEFSQASNLRISI